MVAREGGTSANESSNITFIFLLNTPEGSTAIPTQNNEIIHQEIIHKVAVSNHYSQNIVFRHIKPACIRTKKECYSSQLDRQQEMCHTL